MNPTVKEKVNKREDKKHLKKEKKTRDDSEIVKRLKYVTVKENVKGKEKRIQN